MIRLAVAQSCGRQGVNLYQKYCHQRDGLKARSWRLLLREVHALLMAGTRLPCLQQICVEVDIECKGMNAINLLTRRIADRSRQWDAVAPCLHSVYKPHPLCSLLANGPSTRRSRLIAPPRKMFYARGHAT